MSSYWEVETRDGVVVAAYRNPPMNYLVAEANEELRSHLRRWRNPAVRVVVLTGGVDDQFITHYAVEELVELAAVPERLRAIGTAPIESFQHLLAELAQLRKPVIAAMSGDTMGGGLELSLACDIRIAQRGDFRIGFPEVALGILAGGSGTQRLPRLIGTGPALDFLLRAKVVPPDQALALGIVSELADDARARATEVARELARLPAEALAQTKRAVTEGTRVPLAEGIRIEAEGWLAAASAADAPGVMRDFLEQPLERRRAWLEDRAVL